MNFLRADFEVRIDVCNVQKKAEPNMALPFMILFPALAAAGWWRGITIIIPNPVMCISIPPTAVDDLQGAESFTPFIFN